jgi:hypothetical protein
MPVAGPPHDRAASSRERVRLIWGLVDADVRVASRCRGRAAAPSVASMTTDTVTTKAEPSAISRRPRRLIARCVSTADVNRVRACYRVNFERLVEVTFPYDPGNTFHVNQNITPDAGA